MSIPKRTVEEIRSGILNDYEAAGTRVDSILLGRLIDAALHEVEDVTREEEFERLYQKVVNRISADINGDFDLALDQLEYNVTARARQEARDALEVPLPPKYWSNEERDGMARAFSEASKKHGHYETLFAVGAWLLRHRLAWLDARSRGEKP